MSYPTKGTLYLQILSNMCKDLSYPKLTVSVTWNVLSWSGGHEFEPRSGQTWGTIYYKYFCPKSYFNQNIKSLTAKWSEQTSQWHGMYCHDLEVMSSSPSRSEIEVRSTSVLSHTWTINMILLDLNDLNFLQQRTKIFPYLLIVITKWHWVHSKSHTYLKCHISLTFIWWAIHDIHTTLS